MTLTNLGDTDMAMRLTAAASTSGGVAGANKLWLPLWSGEVIHAYDQFNMFESLVTSKSLMGGMSWDFPTTGTVALNPSWNAGVELGAGTVSPSTTFKVTLDKRPMASHFECDNVDLLITQWDYRSELARQAGLTLSNTRDKQIAAALIAAGAVPHLGSDKDYHTSTTAFQEPSTISTTVLASACTETEALLILQGIEDYFVGCQENDIPVNNVYCAVTPKVFQVIRSLGIPRSPFTSVLNTGKAWDGTTSLVTGVAVTNNYTNNPMFVDNYGQGMNSLMDSLDYMGCKIVKTNHIPKIAHNSVATVNQIGSAKYNLNFSSTSFTANGQASTAATKFSIYGIIFQAEAVASLSLQGLKVDSIADVRRNTQFTVASMMKGTGLIKPEMVKLLVSSAGTATRVNVAAHLDGSDVTGYTTSSFGNLSSGFGAEYKITTTYI